MILVVLFCVQHAAVANCEQTVGDNIMLLNIPFSFNDHFMDPLNLSSSLSSESVASSSPSKYVGSLDVM